MQQQRQQQQQQQSMQKSFLQQQQMSQQQFLQQQQQQLQQMQLMQNGIQTSFRVDTFEYRLLHEVEFRRSLTVRMAGEVVEEEGAIQGPPQAPQLLQKPRSTKVSDGGNATFTVKVSGYPTPRVRNCLPRTSQGSPDQHTSTHVLCCLLFLILQKFSKIH